MDGALELDDWRRRVALLYLTGPTEGEAGAAAFRRGRDELFRDHPQSPLDPGQRARFSGLPWFPYDPAARVTAELRPPEGDGELAIDTGGEDGSVRYRRVARLATPFGDLTRHAGGQSVVARQVELDLVRLDVTRHDPVTQRVDFQNVLLTDRGVRLQPGVLRYAWPSELDLMARLAGLRLRERWGGWRREPYTASTSGLYVSVYEHAGAAGP